MGQVWVRLPVAVGAGRPRVREAALVSSKEEAAAGGAEWGASWVDRNVHGLSPEDGWVSTKCRGLGPTGSADFY